MNINWVALGVWSVVGIAIFASRWQSEHHRPHVKRAPIVQVEKELHDSVSHNSSKAPVQAKEPPNEPCLCGPLLPPKAEPPAPVKPQVQPRTAPKERYPSRKPVVPKADTCAKVPALAYNYPADKIIEVAKAHGLADKDVPWLRKCLEAHHGH